MAPRNCLSRLDSAASGTASAVTQALLSCSGVYLSVRHRRAENCEEMRALLAERLPRRILDTWDDAVLQALIMEGLNRSDLRHGLAAVLVVTA